MQQDRRCKGAWSSRTPPSLRISLARGNDRPEMRKDSLSRLDLLEEPPWSVRPPEAMLVWSMLLPQAMIKPEIHVDSGPCCCEEVGSEEEGEG